MKKIFLAAALLLTGFTLTSTLAQTTTQPAATEPTYNSPPSTAPTTQAALPKELAAAIQNGIDLLKADKIQPAIEALVNPEDLAKMKIDGSFDQLIQRFIMTGREKDLLDALQHAQLQPHSTSDQGNTISFAPQGNTPPLVFRHIKDGWYMR